MRSKDKATAHPGASGHKVKMAGERFKGIVKRFFPLVRVSHPFPCDRFDAKLRQEPGFVSGDAGICARGAGQPVFLPRFTNILLHKKAVI